MNDSGRSGARESARSAIVESQSEVLGPALSNGLAV